MYCQMCQENVNTNKTVSDIGLAKIIQHTCEKCNSFISSKVDKTYSLKFTKRGTERKEDNEEV